MTMPLERNHVYLAQRREALSRDAQRIGIDYAGVSQPEGAPGWDVTLYFIRAAPGVNKRSLPATLPRPEQVTVGGVSELTGANVRVLSVTQNDEREALIVRVDYGPASIQGVRELPRYLLTLRGVDDLDPFFDHVSFSLSPQATQDIHGARSARGGGRPPTPTINYLARDYSAIRQTMLNRLSLLIPGWSESTPADVAVTLVEALAYAADQFSYYQDAIATEAYLATARQRVSVRRHARLLNYTMHEGCNARAWVHFDVREPIDLPARTQLLAGVDLDSVTGAALSPDEFELAVAGGATVFETLFDASLWPQHNTMDFYTWGAHEYTLPSGATLAYLIDNAEDRLRLSVGDVLVLQQITALVPGGQPDPTRCHAVRLTQVEPLIDPLGGQFQHADRTGGSTDVPIVRISWALADALPFDLPVTTGQSTSVLPRFSVARGNIVMADHGLRIQAESLPEVRGAQAYRPRLQASDLTFGVPYTDAAARQLAASAVLKQNPDHALPVLTLTGEGHSWCPRADLLASTWLSREFVVEMDNERTAWLRFGDGTYGEQPSVGASFVAQYRVGNGVAGNVGSGTIVKFLTSGSSQSAAISSVSNLLPAAGGTDAEAIDHVQLNAPQAFQSQDRCVTDHDYATIAMRYTDVRDARASRVWTGSWQTVFLAVARNGNRPVDAAYAAELAEFMRPSLLIGAELAIQPPRWVALHIALVVHVISGHLPTTVEQALLEVFSNVQLSDGRRGFFYPEGFSFGQPVFVSTVVAAALTAPGVAWIEVKRFGRWHDRSSAALETGFVAIADMEIARVDNDPNAPQNGQISFEMVPA
jgi:hypothetical protein